MTSPSAPGLPSRHSRNEPPRALLVAVDTMDGAGSVGDTPTDLLAELGQLTDTLGLRTVGTQIVRLREPQIRYLIGSGKAAELVRLAKDSGAEVIVFDELLSPSQQRNWEKLSGLPVIDREEVILDIFGRHARSRTAVLQVELARARYDLPRLKRMWTHFSRQRGMRGGMGGRGEGEQQIEMDYRMVNRRIQRYASQLRELVRSRVLQRQLRRKRAVPIAAVVGYTNAGKSCLFNQLTKAGVLVEDKLFATLDPTLRRLQLPNNQQLLLTDTVGFIRKLPHQLVEAFKSTLEEVTNADFLIEVIDVTSDAADVHHTTTCAVLKEIGGERLPVITVYNKIDLLPEADAWRRTRRRDHNAVFISAQTGEGIDSLLAQLVAQLSHTRRELSLCLPPTRFDLLAQLHRFGHVQQTAYQDDGILVTVAVPVWLCPQFEPFVREPDEPLTEDATAAFAVTELE